MSGKDGAPPGFFVKAGIGMAAGCCGAFVGTPAEVALIRMTSDGNLPADQRRNYKNAFEALVRIGQGFRRSDRTVVELARSRGFALIGIKLKYLSSG